MLANKFSDRKALLDYLRRNLLIDLTEFGPDEIVVAVFTNNQLIDYDFYDSDASGKYDLQLHKDEDYNEMTIKKLLLLICVELYQDKSFESLVLYINRMIHDISIADAAKMIGRASGVYQRWESGEKIPNDANREHIAASMGFTVEEFQKKYWSIDSE